MSHYRRHQAPRGTYFFTVVAAGREPIFTQEVTRKALRAAIQTVRKEHPFHIDTWILLPDHLHCLWRLFEDNADYPLRWAKIKRLTRRKKALLLFSGLHPCEGGINWRIVIRRGLTYWAKYYSGVAGSGRIRGRSIVMPDLTRQEPFIPFLLKAALIHEDHPRSASSHSR